MRARKGRGDPPAVVVRASEAAAVVAWGGEGSQVPEIAIKGSGFWPMRAARMAGVTRPGVPVM